MIKVTDNRLMDDEPGDAGGAVETPAVAPVVTPSDAKWFDGLPTEMREDQNITKFDSVESMAKSWLNAQRMIGQDKIPMPQTDEDWGNVYGRLGRPDEATGYQVAVPEGVEVNADKQQAFFDKAHQLGLSAKQVEGLAAWEFEQSEASGEATKNSQESIFNEAQNALKQEWGQAFEQNSGIALRAAAEFLSESDKEFVNNAKIDGVKVGDHPVMAKLFHNIGKSMMEGGKLEGVGGEQVMSPQQMEEKRSSLMSHPAYVDNRHPEHKMILRQVQESFEQQFGK
jgi:hypothetical protein